jgi:hypothetical protein
MKKFILTFGLAQVFLLLSLVQIVRADCSYNQSCSSSGDCAHCSATISCDGTNGDLEYSCTANWGGCDWGDVSVYYYNLVCNQ